VFTGIVESLGTIRSIDRRTDILQIRISASNDFSDGIKIGESICINGVCLSVTRILGNDLFFDVMRQTCKMSNLEKLSAGEKVNLEKSLKVGDRLSGHLVSGHIDCTGKIRNISRLGDTAVFEIAIEGKFLAGIVSKGSVAIDGISLTVSDIKRDSFLINIIPHTLKNTVLDKKRIGSDVNVELDMMGKYARGTAQSPLL